MSKFDKIRTMKDIVVYPNKVLRLKTKEIKKVDSGLLTDINSLTKVLEKSENGAGLAAPQVGMRRRIFARKELKSGKVMVFINPKIKKVYGVKDYVNIISKEVSGEEKQDNFLEGCLSFPGYFGMVKRHMKIEAWWQEIEKGELVEKGGLLSGFEAVVFQHELDHLDGVLFVDHVKADGGKFYKEVGGKLIEWDVNELV